MKTPPIKVCKVCFEAHRKDGLVWSVQVGKQPWQSFRAVVFCGVVGQTRYRGPKAPQPRAYLLFVGACVEVSPLGTIAYVYPAEGACTVPVVTDALLREFEMLDAPAS